MKYNEEFYEKQKRGSISSGYVILEYIQKLIHFNSVVDVGCGIGSWLSTVEKMGISDFMGLDGPYAEDKLIIAGKNFNSVDLEKPIHSQRKFDIAISLEVAEHLSVDRADSFICDICKLSDIILFSAAIPYQGGTGHMNENWPEYWAEKFYNNGYVVLDIIREKIWDNDNIEWWYRQNIFLYVKEDQLFNLFPEITPSDPNNLTLIHPEFFLWAIHRENENNLKRKYSQDIYYYRYFRMNDKDSKFIKNPEYGNEFGNA